MNKTCKRVHRHESGGSRSGSRTSLNKAAIADNSSLQLSASPPLSHWNPWPCLISFSLVRISLHQHQCVLLQRRARQPLQLPFKRGGEGGGHGVRIPCPPNPCFANSLGQSPSQEASPCPRTPGHRGFCELGFDLRFANGILGFIFCEWRSFRNFLSPPAFTRA